MILSSYAAWCPGDGPSVHISITGSLWPACFSLSLGSAAAHLTPCLSRTAGLCQGLSTKISGNYYSVSQQSAPHPSPFLNDSVVCGCGVEYSRIRSLPISQPGIDRGYLLRCGEGWGLDPSSLLPSMAWLSSKGAAHSLSVAIGAQLSTKGFHGSLDPASLQACVHQHFQVG